MLPGGARTGLRADCAGGGYAGLSCAGASLVRDASQCAQCENVFFDVQEHIRDQDYGLINSCPPYPMFLPSLLTALYTRAWAGNSAGATYPMLSSLVRHGKAQRYPQVKVILSYPPCFPHGYQQNI